MKIADLKLELEKQAPEWEWICAEAAEASPVAVSSETFEVTARNKATGQQTLPIQVTLSPMAQPMQLASFVCDVLMLRYAAPPTAPQSLLVQS